jgi:hypothetical protein
MKREMSEAKTTSETADPRMTVKDLRERLAAYQDDAPVYIVELVQTDAGYRFGSIKEVTFFMSPECNPVALVTNDDWQAPKLGEPFYF